MNAPSPATGSERARLTTRAALASMAVALLLMTLKAWAAWRSDSSAMLASLTDTGLDLFASCVSLIGLRVAATPPDDEHRFGHGKAEPLAAMVQVAVVSMSALAIGWHALTRLSNGAPVADADAGANAGIAVSAIAIVVTLALVAYQRHIVARTGSVAVHTDQLHYASDLALNLSVIAALVLDRYLGLTGADSAFGLAIAGWLLFSAGAAARQGLGQLMDREWPQAQRDTLIAAAARVPGGETLHDLRTRSSGGTDFAQFHICVPDDTSVADAHLLMDRVEDAIHDDLPGLDMLIHIDPASRCRHPLTP
jgi:ferrous-iron efflux pump FieF